MYKRAKKQEKALHSFRLQIKHLRAELCLLNLQIPNAQKIDRKLREISRTLSPFRDKAVRAKWLRMHGLPVPEESGHTPALAPLRGKVRQLRALVNKFGPAKKNELRNALATSLKKMKKARAAAKKKRSDANFHKWRKRAKDLLYQLEYLGIRNGKTRELSKLTKLLGRAQDCSLIEHTKLPRSTRKVAEKEKLELQAIALKRSP